MFCKSAQNCSKKERTSAAVCACARNFISKGQTWDICVWMIFFKWSCLGKARKMQGGGELPGRNILKNLKSMFKDFFVTTFPMSGCIAAVVVVSSSLLFSYLLKAEGRSSPQTPAALLRWLKLCKTLQTTFKSPGARAETDKDWKEREKTTLKLFDKANVEISQLRPFPDPQQDQS